MALVDEPVAAYAAAKALDILPAGAAVPGFVAVGTAAPLRPLASA